ncbi:hypothetical protein DMB65_10545 [Flavobacterium cheongpyeongense]|uniref:Uncharacterized protein n=1 Tax=Flavobacterium cheongpyeongense TaxID=2212651 RepID=A0A2V4BNT7_9FLAO|nr:hypothetical protein DMB65_10545 [Flavobacterium cheongpyeongense]
MARYITIKHFHSMAKIYSKKALASKDLKPKKEVISFLLSYSQALKVVKIDNKSFEIIAN